jgi:hypothetical protein
MNLGTRHAEELEKLTQAVDRITYFYATKIV